MKIPIRKIEQIQLDVQIYDGKTILIVEDDKYQQNIWSKLLTTSLHRYIFADDGQEALDYLNYMTFDTIITDLYMPCLDGEEFLKRVQNNKCKKIVCTANYDKKIEESLQKYGVSIVWDKTKGFQGLLEYI